MRLNETYSYQNNGHFINSSRLLQVNVTDRIRALFSTDELKANNTPQPQQLLTQVEAELICPIRRIIIGKITLT